MGKAFIRIPGSLMCLALAVLCAHFRTDSPRQRHHPGVSIGCAEGLAWL